MRRLLATTMALGLVITAMGFTGIFAVFTDRATTGTNSAESGEQPRTADLQLGTSVQGDCSDTTYAENLVTGVIDVSDMQPGDGPQVRYLCLKNVGTGRLTLTVSAIDVANTETGCTGDEEASGDATCGTSEVGDGELGSVLIAGVVPVDCTTDDVLPNVVHQVLDSLTTPAALGAGLDPGDELCIRTAVTLPPIGPDASSDQLQQAQSDKVEWRYAFDGTAS